MRDVAAFRKLAVSRTRRPIAPLLPCGDPHLAEDLVQETLAKVYAAWGRAIADGLLRSSCGSVIAWL